MMQHNHCIEMFGPHGSCWGWDSLQVWLHTLADSLIAFSYFAIPASLFYLARKYHVKRLSKVFAVYGFFILGCGLTHVFDVLTVWRGGYWLYLVDGLVRATTGLISVAAAYVTVKCTPLALMGFSRFAVFGRRAVERMEKLETDPRYDTAEDKLWRRHLEEVAALTQMAREVVRTEET